ncbi:uncharacterized protein K452DRAFT_50341 [Aplosporella prunicola CBS 121167]|uniref:RRM domain-containing protein n=1 Tax=Aplosporella prunicola CBS 121167 TaxID=1176127 RepID=A0A6A6BCU2_9PEZI|nr:uncharacterized protein K452DRAFT_50341 [Aplosporella prunicola CBS 121167]KAF2140707.1 hypothetical protein K452DRAFT_50341 [Aplosporella prunicola CBS 121167]
MREETPAQPRRISSGALAEDTTSTSKGERSGAAGQEGQQNPVRAKSRTNISAGVVLANLPQGISAKDLTTMLSPVVVNTIVGPLQRPKHSDIKQYELPAFSHQHGFAIAELADETQVIRAVTSLVGTTINGQALVVRSFKVLPTNKSGSKRRVSGTPAVSPSEPNRKRQRTCEPNMSAPAEPLTPAAGPSHTPASDPAPEPPVEYEDISAEVEARLAAQAAKRAAARKGKAGAKRKRSSGGSLADATDGVRRMSVGAAEEAKETRPKKRARDAEESPVNGSARSTPQTTTESEMDGARAASSREIRRGRRKRLQKQTTDLPPGMTSNGEQGQVDDNPRPQKRWRADVAVNESAWVR